MIDYRPRIADKILSDKLSGAGGILIQGPKWCGKTTTASRQASSAIYLADPDNVSLAQINYSRVLEGAPPRLVDEWQTVPQLWDAARHQIDIRAQTGQFIFTGSAVPADATKIMHSGAGRFSWLTMRTMSLYESGDTTGDVSFAALFDGNLEIYGQSSIDIQRLAFLICRGGWPGVLALPNEHAALERAFDYLQAVISSDINRYDGVTRNHERTKRLLRSLARMQGASATINTLRDDIAQNESMSVSSETVASYVAALTGIFVIEDAPAWNPNLRCKTAIRTANTRYFSDPSIASAALGVGPADLINDLNTMGLLFETLAIRDLRVYASAINGEVYHYRDKTGLECDAVVHLRDGRYGLIKVKLGGDAQIDFGAQTLRKLAGKIDNDRMSAPSFLMVITGVGKYAYRRPDGVLVVPIGSLRD